MFASGSRRFQSTFRVLRIKHISLTGEHDKRLAFYRDFLGLKASERLAQPDYGVYTTFLSPDNETQSSKIELIEGLGDNNPIDKSPSASHGGIHHICFEVDNIEAARKAAMAKGIRFLEDSKRPKVGVHGNPVIFLHPSDCGGILTELEEESK